MSTRTACGAGLIFRRVALVRDMGYRIGTVMKSYTQFEQKAALDHYQSSVNSVRDDDMMGGA